MLNNNFLFLFAPVEQLDKEVSTIRIIPADLVRPVIQICTCPAKFFTDPAKNKSKTFFDGPL